MNIKFLVLFLLILLVPSSYADIRNIQDNYQLIYHVLDEDGDPVGSQTISLKIKKVSDGYWYDFNDDTFKNSGWTSKSTNLSEDTTENYYHYTFNPPAAETSTEQYVLLVDNADTDYGDHQSAIICYQNIGNSDFDYLNNNVTVGDFVSGVIDDDALGSITELPISTDYTSARAGYLDYLDAAISTRSILIASDNIGINWADITNPTTAQNLSGTTISTSQTVASVSGAVGSVTAGVIVTTNNDKTGYGLIDDAITAAKIAASAITSSEAPNLDVAVSSRSTLTAANVWEINVSAYSGAGYAGTYLKNLYDSQGNWLTAVGFSTHAAADIWTVMTRAITDKAGFSLSAAGLDSIWDEMQLGHTTAGTFGKYLDAEISGISISDADIDKIWDEVLSDHLTAGTTGKKLSEMPTPYNIYP